MENNYPKLVHEAITNLTTTIRYFEQGNVNSIPFEGSWSAAQVTVHVLKSLEGLPQLFAAGSIPTPRDPHQLEEELKKIFLNFDTKMESPEFILPGDGPFDKAELIDRLIAVNEKIGIAMQDIDLSQTFPHFSFPGMGTLTGYEFLYFAFCHTTRHTRQVRNIHEAVTKTKTPDKHLQ